MAGLIWSAFGLVIKMQVVWSQNLQGKRTVCICKRWLHGVTIQHLADCKYCFQGSSSLHYHWFAKCCCFLIHPIYGNEMEVSNFNLKVFIPFPSNYICFFWLLPLSVCPMLSVTMRETMNEYVRGSISKCHFAAKALVSIWIVAVLQWLQAPGGWFGALILQNNTNEYVLCLYIGWVCRILYL